MQFGPSMNTSNKIHTKKACLNVKLLPTIGMLFKTEYISIHNDEFLYKQARAYLITIEDIKFFKMI